MQCLKEVTSFGAFQICLNCFGCVLSVSPSALRLWLRLAVLLAAEVFPIFRLGVPPMDHGQALMLQWIIYSNQLKDGTTHPRLGMTWAKPTSHRPARALAAQASQLASAGSHPCEEAPGATATPCTE